MGLENISGEWVGLVKKKIAGVSGVGQIFNESQWVTLSGMGRID